MTMELREFIQAAVLYCAAKDEYGANPHTRSDGDYKKMIKLHKNMVSKYAALKPILNNPAVGAK